MNPKILYPLNVGLVLAAIIGAERTTCAEGLQGIVLEDHSGAPVPAASVRFRNSAGTVVKESDTNRSGRFAVRDLTAGEYHVTVARPNYVTVNARIMAQPDTALDDPNLPIPVLRLIRHAVISGHMTGPRMNGTVIAIEQVAEGQIPRSYSATFSGGEFRIPGIPPGRYLLSSPFVGNNNGAGTSRGIAFYPNNAKPREFVISGGELYDGIQFVVQPGTMSSISGRVVAPSGPQIYTLTMVDSEHPTIRVMNALTAPDGTFKFDNIYEGTYDLYASGPVAPPSFFERVHLVLKGQNVENMEIRLQPGRPVEFALGGGKNATNSACSPDGSITLQGLGGWPMVRDQKITVPITPTAPTRIENIGPGKFAVTVRSTSGDCVGATTLLNVTADAPSERTILSFQPAGSIHGTATSGTSVVLRDMTPGRDSPVQAYFPTSSSEFQFDHLAPGEYCISRQPATDALPHWSPESGCAYPVIKVAPGESKRL